MFQHQRIWLPDGEKHMVEWMNKSGEIVDGRGTYQIKKLRAAMFHVKQFRSAIDIGAHVGFWSMHLARHFKVVHAFEPVQAHRDCWMKNLHPHLDATDCDAWDSVDNGITIQNGNAILYPCALGAALGSVTMFTPPGSSGGTYIAGFGDIQMHRLDDFDLVDVDFIKLDCEGYEFAALQGAQDTLERCRPCVIVEQKQHIMQQNFGTSGTPAVDFLTRLGAKVRQELSGDYILTWD